MAANVLQQNIRIALQSIRGHLLRTVLTALIIAIGIMALVGILTAIDAIKLSLTGKFALLGANTFAIQNTGPNIQIGRGGERPKRYPAISYQQALEFKEKFNAEAALTSVSYIATGIAEVQHGEKKNQSQCYRMGG